MEIPARREEGAGWLASGEQERFPEEQVPVTNNGPYSVVELVNRHSAVLMNTYHPHQVQADLVFILLHSTLSAL